MKLNRYVVIVAAAVVLVGGAAAGYVAWKQYEASALPAGIVSVNGRVEATQVDISTKIRRARDRDHSARRRHRPNRERRRPYRHVRNHGAVAPGAGVG